MMLECGLCVVVLVIYLYPLRLDRLRPDVAGIMKDDTTSVHHAEETYPEKEFSLIISFL